MVVGFAVSEKKEILNIVTNAIYAGILMYTIIILVKLTRNKVNV